MSAHRVCSSSVAGQTNPGKHQLKGEFPTSTPPCSSSCPSAAPRECSHPVNPPSAETANPNNPKSAKPSVLSQPGARPVEICWPRTAEAPKFSKKTPHGASLLKSQTIPGPYLPKNSDLYHFLIDLLGIHLYFSSWFLSPDESPFPKFIPQNLWASAILGYRAAASLPSYPNSQLLGI